MQIPCLVQNLYLNRVIFYNYFYKDRIKYKITFVLMNILSALPCKIVTKILYRLWNYNNLHVRSNATWQSHVTSFSWKYNLLAPIFVYCSLLHIHHPQLCQVPTESPCHYASNHTSPCNASQRPLCASHAHDIDSNGPSSQNQTENQWQTIM